MSTARGLQREGENCEEGRHWRLSSAEGQVPSQRRRRPTGATGKDGRYSSAPHFGELIFNLSFLPRDDKTLPPLIMRRQ